MTGPASSGSEHDGEISFFSQLIHSFLEPKDNEPHNYSSGEDSDSSAAIAIATDRATKLRSLLNPSPPSDSFRSLLKSELHSGITHPKSLRAVMARLREKGFNAGICKARWESAKGLTAGRYEYIDVINGDERYIVDLGFAGEFALARATEEYERVAGALPEVVVARPEEVGAVLRIMAEAARRSLRRGGLSVPPWRKKKFMIAKWLGPYLRTVNEVPAIGGGGGEVGFRAVGFGKMGIAGEVGGGCG